MNIAAIPAMATGPNCIGIHHDPAAAINTAPARPPALPSNVIAPDRPDGTTFQVVINRGGLGLSNPISVAQVSAVEAAIAPAYADNAADDGLSPYQIADNAATMPFAST